MIQRPPVETVDGTTWIRASSLGLCPLKLAIINSGRRESFSRSTLAAFSAGHEIEELVKFKLRSMGLVVSEEQRELELNLGSVRIAGHWDGQVDLETAGTSAAIHPSLVHLAEAGWDGGPCVLEIKSMNGDDYQRFVESGLKKFRTYEAQISVYSIASKLPILYAVQSKANITDLAIRYYPSPPMDLGDIAIMAGRILDQIERLAGNDQVLCLDHENEKYSCSFSEYHFDCATVVEDPEFENKARQYLELSTQINSMKEIQNGLRLDLETALGQSKKLKSGAYSAQRVTTSRRDYAGFLRANPHLSEAMEKHNIETSHVRIYGPRSSRGIGLDGED